MAGLQVACKVHVQGGGESWCVPQKNLWNLDHLILDYLCRLPLLGHSYILSPFHPYIAFMPVQFLMCINIYNFIRFTTVHITC